MSNLIKAELQRFRLITDVGIEKSYCDSPTVAGGCHQRDLYSTPETSTFTFP